MRPRPRPLTAAVMRPPLMFRGNTRSATPTRDALRDTAREKIRDRGYLQRETTTGMTAGAPPGSAASRDNARRSTASHGSRRRFDHAFAVRAGTRRAFAPDRT